MKLDPVVVPLPLDEAQDVDAVVERPDVDRRRQGQAEAERAPVAEGLRADEDLGLLHVAIAPEPQRGR